MRHRAATATLTRRTFAACVAASREKTQSIEKVGSRPGRFARDLFDVRCAVTARSAPAVRHRRVVVAMKGDVMFKRVFLLGAVGALAATVLFSPSASQARSVSRDELVVRLVPPLVFSD